MDARLLRAYSAELRYLRELGGEFAREFPKVAGRLGLDGGVEVADPYVERLLEGVAFLTARVQIKLDSQFQTFTQHLLDIVYPHYLAPTPAMAVIQFVPSAPQAIQDGFPIPRGTALRSIGGRGEVPVCDFRTAHDVALWPLVVAEAEYLPTTASVTAAGIADLRGAKAALRIVLRSLANIPLATLKGFDRLAIFLTGSDEVSAALHEQLLGNAVGMVARPTKRPIPWQMPIGKSAIEAIGFGDDEALLPVPGRSFQGYRYLHEYFAFPERFNFVALGGLGPAARRVEGDALELIVLLDRTHATLPGAVIPERFALHATPAINLFPRRADPVHLTDRSTEVHVVPDRTRPLDFEVHTITRVFGLSGSGEAAVEFRPLYAASDLQRPAGSRAFFTARREPRVLSSRQRRVGPRSSYLGSEIWLALVDADEAPYRHDLRTLSVETLCSNRDLPLGMANEFTLEVGAPVEAVRCIAGPSRPRPTPAEGVTAWRAVSHLALNHLSLADLDERHGAAALRDLLALYADPGDAIQQRRIEGVRSIAARPVIRRLPKSGPIAVARGLEIAVTLEESLFEGAGAFLLASVLDRFFARYVAINSFTETVARTVERGEIMRWPARIGRRPTL
jgi:type VI secretion system protein ImpG